MYIIRYDRKNALKAHFEYVVYLTWQYNCMEFLLLKSLKTF